MRTKKKDSHRQQGPLHGSSSHLWCFEPVRVVRPNFMISVPLKAYFGIYRITVTDCFYTAPATGRPRAHHKAIGNKSVLILLAQ